MVDFSAFKGWRPPAALASEVASVPYDVLSTQEARAIIESNSKSMMRVIRPDGEMPEGSSLYSDMAYNQALASFNDLISRGLLVRDETAHFYVYAQQMGEHRQVGLMGLGSIDDYENDRIKKHEYTRPDKEEDRVRHIDAVGAHLGPVFLSYRGQSRIDALVESVVAQRPDVEFRADDGVEHVLWCVSSVEMVHEIHAAFSEVDAFYIADGHHRAAAAARLGKNRDASDARSSFLVVAFPDHALKILSYNRVVHHLNGHSVEAIMGKLEALFDMEPLSGPKEPTAPKCFSMYIEGQWYALSFKSNVDTFKDDPVLSLDVSLLQNYVLAPIFGVEDPRTDTGIEFVGGIRGLSTLSERADKHQSVAFSMYPTSMHELLSVADSGTVMPPKSTWFEPKLRTGMVVNRFRE
jgi:uncharacterized protein (DUF1015 family)